MLGSNNILELEAIFNPPYSTAKKIKRKSKKMKVYLILAPMMKEKVRKKKTATKKKKKMKMKKKKMINEQQGLGCKERSMYQISCSSPPSLLLLPINGDRS
jgi:23S rRNA G2445 N2-methylase RlmL